jgi:hypothetical protein
MRHLKYLIIFNCSNKKKMTRPEEWSMAKDATLGGKLGELVPCGHAELVRNSALGSERRAY